MGVTLDVTGNGHFAGSNADLSDYSVTEDSTPVDPSDQTGGIGQINFTVVEDTSVLGSVLLLNDTVKLADQSNGSTQGIVSTVNAQDGVASVTADNRLIALVSIVTAQPYIGTLGGALTYYLSLVGIVTGISIDATITGRAVAYSGWTGSAWDFIKEMCTAQQVEISLVSTNIVLRPLRTRIARTTTNSGVTRNVTFGSLAQSIEIYYYNTASITNKLVYPPGGWNTSVQVYTVDAGALVEFDISLGASVSSIVQPVPALFVGPFDNSTSQYAVAGNDGLPIPVAQWQAGGGSMVVTINPDTVSAHVKLLGMADPTGQYAPYSIAVSSGSSSYYSSLRILGTGVSFTKNLINILTGAPAAMAPTAIGVTVDNPFITTLTQAYTAGMKAAQSYAGMTQTLSVNATIINRTGSKGNVNYPLFTKFTTDYTGKTFAQFDTTNTGQTFAQFDAAYFAQVQDNFDNQAFGNVGGTRVLDRQAYYRIRSGTITPSGISYSAERDTIVSDFDTVWTGKTFAQFDTKFTGKTFADFGVIPLWS
jgi:hypothetical protein